MKGENELKQLYLSFRFNVDLFRCKNVSELKSTIFFSLSEHVKYHVNDVI